MTDTLLSTILQVYRDFAVAGVPASGPSDPDKPAIRALLAEIVGAIANGGEELPAELAADIAAVAAQMEVLPALSAAIATVLGQVVEPAFLYPLLNGRRVVWSAARDDGGYSPLTITDDAEVHAPLLATETILAAGGSLPMFTFGKAAVTYDANAYGVSIAEVPAAATVTAPVIISMFTFGQGFVAYDDNGFGFIVGAGTTDKRDGLLLPSKNLAIHSDSLGTDTQGFADELAALVPDRLVYKGGVGGSKATEGAVRAGEPTTAIVAGNTIPTSGAVTLSGFASNPFGGSLTLPWTYLADVFDVPGLLSIDGGSVVTFTRTTSGGAITVPNPCPVVIRSTIGRTSGASDTVSLRSVANRLPIIRFGHNDLYIWFFQHSGSYSRDAVKAAISAIYRKQTVGRPSGIVCSITSGLNWLTTARKNALGLTGSGAAASDAETIAACVEREAINRWMSQEFEGYIDLLAVAAANSHMASVNLGSGHSYGFGDATWFTDGTHGAQGGIAQIAEAAAINSLINTLNR
jgi:hypothetical protein